MARRPKPWYRAARQAWFVMIDGVQHNLGPDKEAAYGLFYQLMRQPTKKRVSPHSLVAIIDEFLDWVQRRRAPDTYEAYRYRLQRFAERYPDLSLAQLRPHHVEKWAESYDIKQNTRRNYLRSVKRCMRWAKRQGYIDSNPIESLELPAQQSKEVVVKPEEFERLLTIVRDDTFRELIVTAWETGCRPQEILRVEARHVELANHPPSGQRPPDWDKPSRSRRPASRRRPSMWRRAASPLARLVRSGLPGVPTGWKTSTNRHPRRPRKACPFGNCV